MKSLSFCVFALGGLMATEASAQVTQTYSYDANGRLIGVSTSGASGTNTATYTYDDANNRTYRSQSGVSAYAMLPQMPADRLLLPHQALISPDGAFTLAVRPSGRLELWLADTQIDTRLIEAFEVTADGEARFLAPSGLTVENARLQLTGNGALAMLNASEQVLWRSDAAQAGEGGR